MIAISSHLRNHFRLTREEFLSSRHASLIFTVQSPVVPKEQNTDSS